MDWLDIDLAKMPTLAERAAFTRTRRYFDEYARSKVDMDDPDDVARMLRVGERANAEAVAALAAELWTARADQRLSIAQTRLSEPVHVDLITQLHAEIGLLTDDERLLDIVDRATPSWRWADQQPGALQTRVHPAIRCDPQLWSLPAGWAGIVNELNQSLYEAIGPYTVSNADQKLFRLRYYATPAAGFTEESRRIIPELERRIAELEAMRRTLLHLVHACHGDGRPDCPILDDLATEPSPSAEPGTRPPASRRHGPPSAPGRRGAAGRRSAGPPAIPRS